VGVAYATFESPPADDGNAAWVTPSVEKPGSPWKQAELPLGRESGTGELPAGHALRCLVHFDLEEPDAFGDYFIICNSSPGLTSIYINGKRALAYETERSRYRFLHLKPATAALLQRGRNILAIEVTAANERTQPSLDIGFDGLHR